MTDGEIINRIANSSLIQINLDDYYPQGERVGVDIAEYLKEGLILIEKEFRAQVEERDWTQYTDKYVFLHCSADAVVPLWAFMLISLKLNPYVKLVVMGEAEDLERAIFESFLQEHDFEQYQDKSVIVKGCGSHPIPESVFVEFTNRLQQAAKNIMFGEACSAVPLFKKKKD